jgi:beta-1,2-mannobiose phosphorylase / 1,2-beta-oligomannan phosphorylase
MKTKSSMPVRVGGIPLAVVGCGESVCMLVRTESVRPSLQLSWSEDGFDFVEDKKKVSIVTVSGKQEKVSACRHFSISCTPTSYLLAYTRAGKTRDKDILVIAKSRNLYEWKAFSELPSNDSRRATVEYSTSRQAFQLYRDGLFIRHQEARTLVSWKEKPSPLLTSRFGHFDSDSLSIIGSTLVPGAVFVMYDASVIQGTHTLLQAGGVLFDVNDPKRVIWRSEGPIWQGLLQGKKKAVTAEPLGFAIHHGKFLIYWSASDGTIIAASLPALFTEVAEIHHPQIFKKFSGNPVISPRHHLEWEREGTFNPAVIQDEDGTIHILYRAIGTDGISRIGYARSENGTKFLHRSPRPVFEPSPGLGLPDPLKARGPVGYHPAIYTSGGGWGGSEDPRAVRIGEWIYMTYVSFEGWDSVRIALTAITVQDFRAGNWRWKQPKLISPEKEVNKNWIIFPEKIRGKYAILHTIAPSIGIEYVDSLLTLDRCLTSNRPAGPQPGRKDCWDTKLRGAGAPPLKTPLGWLLLYHAVDGREPHKYKLGAMLLDLKDPMKVLYRSAHPILSPDMPYENEGKPGVVYASGAAIRGDDLYVYYGGGDKVVCVASTPLKDLLDYLVSGSPKSYSLNRMSVAVA